VFDLVPAKRVDKERSMLWLNVRQLRPLWHQMGNVYDVFARLPVLAYG
jgi:hypothetical protein